MLRIVVAAGLLLLCAASARAQFDSAQVSGVVQDSTGAVLPGVDITLVDTGTGAERRTVTNQSGVYTFPNVPVGTYKVDAALSGFRGTTKTGVQVNAGVNFRVDVQLEVGQLSETVQVQAVRRPRSWGSTIVSCFPARSSIRKSCPTSLCKASPRSTTMRTRAPGTTSSSSGPTTSRTFVETTRSRAG
jgi:hypothetical protein